MCAWVQCPGFRWKGWCRAAKAEGSRDPVQEELTFEVPGSSDNLKNYLNIELLIFLFTLS